VQHPGDALDAALAIGRGLFYKWWYPLRGIRFSAGRGLRVSGRLRIRGPGRVVFGDHVHVGMTVTPYTYTRNACIRVGSGVFLNGTRFGCVQQITIGDRCIVAECRIMDTNFHSLHANRHDPAAPITQEPVELAENVWVAVDAALLPGTRIGRDSVVAIAAVCKGEYPAGTVVAGNPAKVVGRVPGSAPAADRVAGGELQEQVVTEWTTTATVAR
jgi:acetyltransferase-like isoleucine patch superfamily enzyme